MTPEQKKEAYALMQSMRYLEGETRNNGFDEIGDILQHAIAMMSASLADTTDV